MRNPKSLSVNYQLGNRCLAPQMLVHDLASPSALSPEVDHLCCQAKVLVAELCQGRKLRAEPSCRSSSPHQKNPATFHVRLVHDAHFMGAFHLGLLVNHGILPMTHRQLLQLVLAISPTHPLTHSLTLSFSRIRNPGGSEEAGRTSREFQMADFVVSLLIPHAHMKVQRFPIWRLLAPSKSPWYSLSVLMAGLHLLEPLPSQFLQVILLAMRNRL